jgi:hypothetical protein
MKGKLYIKDNGLQFVQYHIINSIRSLPLHRDSVRLLSLRSDKQTEHMHMEEVDFEIVKEYTDSNTNQVQQYAKLTQCPGLNIELDENGKPLTYWGGLEKYKQESYICPHTNVQCDDECCVSAENCNIDNDELEYPISEDCEAVKNWDSFVEQKNNELEVEKLASDYTLNRGISKGVEQRMIDSFVSGFNKAKENYEVASSVRELHQYKLGLEDGYKKAKETLYTKEEMLECWNTSIIDITTFETFIELLKHPKK